MGGIPAIKQQKRTDNLLSVAEGLPGAVTVDQWRSGASFNPQAQLRPKGLTNGCEIDEEDSNARTWRNLDTIDTFKPYPVEYSIECIPGGLNETETEAQIRDSLTQDRSFIAEQQMSVATLTLNPSLKSVGIPLNNIAVNPSKAVGMLLAARNAEGIGYIHVPELLAGSFAKENQTNEFHEGHAEFIIGEYVPNFVPDIPLTPAIPDDEETEEEDESEPAVLFTAPTATEAWVAITGAVEYGFTNIDGPKPITSKDAVDANADLYTGKVDLFVRWETTQVYLVKVSLV